MREPRNCSRIGLLTLWSLEHNLNQEKRICLIAHKNRCSVHIRALHAYTRRFAFLAGLDVLGGSTGRGADAGSGGRRAAPRRPASQAGWVIGVRGQCPPGRTPAAVPFLVIGQGTGTSGCPRDQGSVRRGPPLEGARTSLSL